MHMKILATVVVLVLVIGVGSWMWFKNSSAAPRYRLAKAEKGELIVTVSATGTVQPVTNVQVGTQVSGTIQKLNADFNSRVTAGQIVAQIDPALFQAHVDQDRANLLKSQSDVDRVKATLVQAEKELNRSKELAKKDLISPSDLDAAIATYDSLVAQVKVAESTVEQNRAALAISDVNLKYTQILSPIDGVVVSRNVDVGQTVAASLSAPTLFVIADSLKHVQIQASVPEADIGKIAKDQPVTFTVDAYREVKFKGTVFQVRLSPSTVQNVVTYTVLVNAENPEEKLLPGMTANVLFEVARFADVLQVPNAALRFVPPDVEKPPEPTTARRPARGDNSRDPKSRVWVSGDGGPVAVAVVTGATDGAYTQIMSGDLREDQEVLIGMLAEGRDSQMTNPFGPRQGSSSTRRP
ncbi:MAG: efflux RND transporter periplasmic adaptor subunit [Planctomycetes bacterium]|nr:efflux RND transporter periplasmic adaptor subunit [Planctomycetota bacterium]